jgi:signal transduction histidine kinase/CheY-like chemotaxis protein
VRALARDPFAVTFALVASGLWLPGLFVSWGWVDEFGVSYLLHAASVGMGMFACLSAAARANRRERAFWAAITLALGAWLLSLGLQYAIDAQWKAHPALSLVGDGCYGLIYLFLLLALELRPHGAPRGRNEAEQRGPELAGAVVFVLAAYAYFVAAPQALAREVYLGWLPSHQFYLLLDLFLAARLVSLVVSVEDRAWRATYTWLLAACALWATLDGCQLLALSGALAHALPLRLTDALWFLTPLLVGMGARWRCVSSEREVQAAAGARDTGRGDLVNSLWGGSALVYALALGLVHLADLVVGLGAPAASASRGLIAAGAGLVLISLAFLSELRLRAEHARFGRERAALDERMGRAQRVESLGQLTGGVVHEINNMLLIVRMSAEELNEKLPHDSALRARVGEILTASRRAAELGSQVLALSRTGGGGPQPVDLGRAAERVADLLRRVAGEHIRVETEVAPEPLAILADPDRLENALVNLGLNARDAMPRGGTLRIAVGRSGAFARLSVRDDGVGMDEATRARVFEPFFTTKPSGQGTGLGLPSVRAFVHDASGSIEVESAPGRGTTFHLHLPLGPELPAPAAASAGDERLDAPLAVLVVEDELGVREVLRNFLCAEGCRVAEACDGAQALEWIQREGAPGLVLSDVSMPGMGGPELLERLSELGIEVPAVLMSGYPQVEERVAALGAVLLSKPFTRAELARAMRAALALVPRPAIVEREAAHAGRVLRAEE